MSKKKTVVENLEPTEETIHLLPWEEDIPHVGIYKKEKFSPEEAAENTIARISRILPNFKKNMRVLILETGAGRTAQYLVKKHGSKIDCIHLVDELRKQHQKDTEAEEELEDNPAAFTGNFRYLPFERETFDIVWSQDVMHYSTDKERVFREVARVLQPEGRFIFTTLFEGKNCGDKSLLDPIHDFYERETLGNIKHYQTMALRADLERVLVKRMPKHFLKHMAKVRDVVARKRNKTHNDVSPSDLADQFIAAAEAKCLNWGFLLFQKRNI